ncbi:hypothetical protein DL769_007701 [Monosporascus sp. CRB-8-3]|nr:hypothetical protein DL769_007701 [Monosporascus sp. CRB-8-3]
MSPSTLQPQAENKAGPSSIGTELEFFVAVRIDDGSQPTVPKMFASSEGNPLVVPEAGSRGRALETYVIDHVRHTITLALEKKLRGKTRVIASPQDLDDREARHLGPYMGWTVEREGTAPMPEDILGQSGVSDYMWVDLEVKSPALWATDGAFLEILDVVQALQQTYWTCTPPTTALQFHYGCGKDYIPFRNLRRIAALLYAADPLLAQLHPQHRRNNTYSLSNRLYSILAHGLTESVANGDSEAPETEPEAPDHRGEGSDSQREVKVQGSTKFKTVFARGMLTGYDISAHTFYITDPDTPLSLGPVRVPRGYTCKPLGILTAVREILHCTTTPGISERMGTLRERPAYDFGAYADSRYMRETPRRRQQPKRTIEFRQAAGTMDPDEVVAHAKVVVRLCEWASTAHLAEFWKLILDCEAGESTPSWFDVFDLLARLDLNAEAKVLQRSMAPRYGIEILDEDAGTAKYPETLDPKAWNWDRRTIV